MYQHLIQSLIILFLQVCPISYHKKKEHTCPLKIKEDKSISSSSFFFSQSLNLIWSKVVKSIQADKSRRILWCIRAEYFLIFPCFLLHKFFEKHVHQEKKNFKQRKEKQLPAKVYKNKL